MKLVSAKAHAVSMAEEDVEQKKMQQAESKPDDQSVEDFKKQRFDQVEALCKSEPSA